MFSKLIPGQFNWEKATPEQKLEAIAALEPDEPRRLISIADAYAKSGRADTALATIDRLSDPLPDEPGVRAEVARVWLAAAQNGRSPHR